MFDSFLIVLMTYICLGFIGVGPYFLLTPAFLRQKYLMGFFMPLYGIVLISIVNMYLLIAGGSVYWAFPLYLFIGCILQVLLFAVHVRPRLLKKENILQFNLRFYLGEPLQHYEALKKNVKEVVVFPILALIALMFIIAPVLNAGFPTTAYRLGVDQAGYSEAAEFLFRGGTLNKAKEQIMEQTEEKLFSAAKKNNDRALNFNSFVDTEFLLKAKRLGYPAFTASLTRFLRLDHVYRTIFLALSISAFITIGLICFLCVEFFQIPRWLAMVFSLVFVFNVNYLNVYYEGQYAEVFTAPLLLIMLILYLHLRTQPFSNRLQDLRQNRQLQLAIALFGVVFASLLTCYNEANFFLFAFVAISVIVELIWVRHVKSFPLICVGLGALLGFCIVFPYSIGWIAYTIANLRNIKVAGFSQPHWASFAEIIGLLNMYIRTGYILRDRNFLDLLANILLSGILLGLLLYSFVKNKTLDKVFWITPLCVVFLIFFKVRYIEGLWNYQYMKSYTLLLPLLFSLTLSAAYFFVREKRILHYLLYMMILAIVFNGLEYIHQFMADGSYVTQDMFELARVHDHFDLNRFAVKTYVSRISDFMLAPLFSQYYWLNVNSNNKVLNPHWRRSVLIFLNRKDVRCPDCIINQYRDSIVYENASFLLMNTGLKLGDLCRLSDSLGNNTDPQWRVPKKFEKSDYFQNDITDAINQSQTVGRGMQKSYWQIDHSQCHLDSLIQFKDGYAHRFRSPEKS